MPFDLLTKRHRHIQCNVEQDSYVYAVKREELIEFAEQIRKCSGKFDDGVHLFKTMFNVDPREIIGYGDSTYNKAVCDGILQTEIVKEYGVGKRQMYKCFCASDHFNPMRIVGNIDHTDGKSSWNCLLNTMGRPRNLIIRVVKTGKKRQNTYESFYKKWIDVETNTEL